jgi:hypothetical protein
MVYAYFDFVLRRSTGKRPLSQRENRTRRTNTIKSLRVDCFISKRSQKQNKYLTPRLPGEYRCEHLTLLWMKCTFKSK